MPQYATPRDGTTGPEAPATRPPPAGQDTDPGKKTWIEEPDGDTVKQPDGDSVPEPGGDQIEQGENPDEIRQPEPDSVDSPPSPPEIRPPPD